MRVRTTAVAVVVVGVALVIGGATLVRLLESSLTDQVQTAAELRAADVAGVLESGTPPRSLAVSDDEDLVIQVIDPQGRVVTSSEKINGEGPLADLQPGQARTVGATAVGEEHSFLLTATEADAPTGRFVVLVGRSNELVNESTDLVTAILVGGVPLLLILVGVTTWAVVGRTLAPVDAIRREVDEVSGRELHRRVPDPDTGDEIARLAATMNRMLDRLEGSQARQQRFISDASHELRSPVATIRHHAEIALAHPGQGTDADLAEVVLAEDLRVERLVEDLLFLAQADERTLQVSRHVLDLDDIVFDEAGRLRATTDLRVDISGVSGGRVRGDATQLRRVLRNLCDNAIRHARSTIWFALDGTDAQVVLSVTDDGDGVDPEERERVFERFVRLDEARARDDGGNGLGLAITAEIVAAHGGSVAVVEGQGGGARFEVVLPAADDVPSVQAPVDERRR